MCATPRSSSSPLHRNTFMLQAGAFNRTGFDPTVGSELSRPDQQAAWPVAGGASAGKHHSYGGQGERGGGGGGWGAASAASDQGVALGDGASAAGETDLGWLSAEQLAAMGLAPREDVVKSTSMVRDAECGTGGDTEERRG